MVKVVVASSDVRQSLSTGKCTFDHILLNFCGNLGYMTISNIKESDLRHQN
jgi:hypothetical protein